VGAELAFEFGYAVQSSTSKAGRGKRLKLLTKAVSVGVFVLAYSVQAADIESNSVSIVQNALAKLWDYQANHGSERGWSLGLELPEVVINQYIHQLIASGQRQGVLDAQVKFVADNRVALTCNLDVPKVCGWDAKLCKQAKLGNRASLPLEAQITMDVSGGVAAVSVTRVTSPGFTADPALLKKLLVTVASHQPEHFELGKPIHLAFPLSAAVHGNMLTVKVN
jgi:hypothetical protein